MENLWYLLGVIPQVVAMIHYFRTRPEGYWFWIILILYPFGAFIYFFAVILTKEGAVDMEGKVKASLRERKRARMLMSKVDAGEALPYDYGDLGDILFKQKNYKKAAEILEIAVKRAPENLDARFTLALSLEKLGEYRQAGAYLEKLVVQDSKFKYGEAMHALARCYRGAGEKEAAMSAYRRVLAQSSFAQARYEMAELLIESGEKDQARDLLQKLITDAKTADLPSYQLRIEKRWARKAKSLLATLR